jgi:branched-chain amino acid aminotransferase
MEQATTQPASPPSTGTPLWSDGAGFVDGEFVPIAEARIPITETGFLRSDLTYDVVGVWNGSFFRLDDHLDRFENGCRELRLTLPVSRSEIVAILQELVARTGLRKAYVEVICTRGVAEKGIRDPRRFNNRFYAWAVPFVWILGEAEAETGMDAVIARTVRRIPSSSIDQRVKNFHWGDLTRGLYEAYDRGARFPILLDAEDNVTEGAGYNVFALIGGELYTPDTGVLEGITRKTVLELAGAEGIATHVAPLPVARLAEAAEMFTTTTAGGVMPVTTLDGEPVGDGNVGPVTRRLRARYWAAHDDPRFSTPVPYRDGGEAS